MTKISCCQVRTVTTAVLKYQHLKVKVTGHWARGGVVV